MTLFPLSDKYDPYWIQDNSMGDNPLYLAETMAHAAKLKPGQRVLELGCGKALAAIFLAREFDVQVFAVDRFVEPEDNLRRIRNMECSDKVFPLYSDVRKLPFPKDYFDHIFSFNSYYYFGTDERFLPYIVQYLKDDGHIGMVDTCFRREISSSEEVPDFLKESYRQHWYYVHSVEWWKKQWAKTGLVKVEKAEVLDPGNEKIRRAMIKLYRDLENESEIVDFLEHDEEGFINTFLMLARRSKKQVFLEEE